MIKYLAAGSAELAEAQAHCAKGVVIAYAQAKPMPGRHWRPGIGFVEL